MFESTVEPSFQVSKKANFFFLLLEDVRNVIMIVGGVVKGLVLLVWCNFVVLFSLFVL